MPESNGRLPETKIPLFLIITNPLLRTAIIANDAVNLASSRQKSCVKQLGEHTHSLRQV